MSGFLSENFVAFLINKFARSRPQSLAAIHISPEITGCSSTWRMFSLISLQTFVKTLLIINLRFGPDDSIPSHFFK